LSHSKERTEKTCLNCGTQVQGRYCQSCGQENIEPKETVWGLITHFFYDITHFDGKFFSTVRYLLLKPGFLSQEYIRGKRASYLHPIRMYVFTAAFFFIIFFSLFKPGELMLGADTSQEIKKFNEAAQSLKETIPKTGDSITRAAKVRALAKIEKKAGQLRAEMDAKTRQDSLWAADPAKATSKLLDSLAKEGKLDSTTIEEQDSTYSILPNGESKLSVQKRKRRAFSGNDFNIPYRSLIAYDSVQAELPASRRDGWLTRSMIHRAIKMTNKFSDDRNEAMALFMEKFMHTLPQAMFVSLPAFALILLLLYARRRFYYVDHGIFTIHFYCATYLMLLLYFALDRIQSLGAGLGFLKILKFLAILAIFFYLYKAMRRFYHQGRMKTLLKFLILNFFVIILIGLLVGVFLLVTLFEYN
jgi:hypothetical protein